MRQRNGLRPSFFYIEHTRVWQWEVGPKQVRCTLENPKLGAVEGCWLMSKRLKTETNRVEHLLNLININKLLSGENSTN